MLLKNNTNEGFALLANCQAINCWYLYLYVLLIFIMAGRQIGVKRPLHKLLLRWKIHTHKVFPKVWLSHPWNQCWTSTGHRSVGLCIAFPTVLLGKSILIKVSLCWQEYRPTGREIFVCIYVHTYMYTHRTGGLCMKKLATGFQYVPAHWEAVLCFIAH